jgi:uncharacterized membrane protein
MYRRLPLKVVQVLLIVLATVSFFYRQYVEDQLWKTLPRTSSAERSVPIALMHGSRVFANQDEYTKLERAGTIQKVVFPVAGVLFVLSIALGNRKKDQP